MSERGVEAAHDKWRETLDKSIAVQELASYLAIVSNSAANVGVFHGKDGVFLIDDGFADQVDEILGAVARLTSDPIRLVINTHWHHDHVGGNARLAELSVPILAHDNTRLRMSAEQYLKPLRLTIPPVSSGCVPNRTITDSMSWHVNGDIMQLIHLPRAHTDGDLVVKWHRANIIMAADFFVPEEDLPFVDTEGGGNFGGFIDAVGTIIDLCDKQTRIVPGHHRSIARREDLIEFQQKLIRIERLAAQQFDAGVALANVNGPALYREYYRGGLFEPQAFIEMMYDSLARGRSMSNRGTN